MESKGYWMTAYQEELKHALSARSVGNEGMARVCARRAAGIVLGEYLERLGYTNLTHSAYDRIIRFTALPGIDPKFKVIANHFLLKVDHNHHLPGTVDLITEVQTLEKELLNGSIN